MSIHRPSRLRPRHSFLRILTIAIFGALGASLFLAGSAAAQPSAPDTILINEVFYSGGSGEDWVEIKNIGTETVDVTNWWLCSRFDYVELVELTVMAGPTDRILAPGELLVVQLDGGPSGIDHFDDTSADVALYSFNGFNFSRFMGDFLQYNTMENVGRGSRAASRGIWLELQESPPLYDSTLPAAPGESLSLCDPADDFLTLGSDYQSTVPTPGAENTTCGSAVPPLFTDGFESGNTSAWTNAVPQ